MQRKSQGGLFSLYFREDLEQTQDGNATCERITTGNIKLNIARGDVPIGASPQQWYKVYKHRKWNLIEENRSKYLKRVNAKLSDIELSDLQH